MALGATIAHGADWRLDTPLMPPGDDVARARIGQLCVDFHAGTVEVRMDGFTAAGAVAQQDGAPRRWVRVYGPGTGGPALVAAINTGDFRATSLRDQAFAYVRANPPAEPLPFGPGSEVPSIPTPTPTP